MHASHPKVISIYATPRSALYDGFSMLTIPLAAAVVPVGCMRKSAMITPTITRPARPIRVVGLMYSPYAFADGRRFTKAWYAHVPASPTTTPVTKQPVLPMLIPYLGREA